MIQRRPCASRWSFVVGHILTLSLPTTNDYKARSAFVSRLRHRCAATAGSVPAPSCARRRAEAVIEVRSPPGRQPLIEQLPRADHASDAARGGARRDAPAG